MADFPGESGILDNHFRLICGLDEAGRGCLLDPVVAGQGYPTQKHKNMILWQGETIFHRKSFKLKHGC
jgi:ribonuclease HII